MQKKIRNSQRDEQIIQTNKKKMKKNTKTNENENPNAFSE